MIESVNDWIEYIDANGVKQRTPKAHPSIVGKTWETHEEPDGSNDKVKSALESGKAEPIIELQCLGDIEPETITWLWEGRIPSGMLTVISGDPNTGKSMLIVDLASRVSRGTPWPDQKDIPNPAGDVILLCAEDGLADTVRVRVDNAGGDPSHIFILTGLRHPETPADMVDPFSIARDLRHLDQVLKGHPDTRLVVFDPLDAYMGSDTDTHRKGDVQRVLSGLVAVAERHSVAIVGVMHLRKAGAEKAMYKTMGSLGFVSAPRAAWALSRDKANPAVRLLTCIKLNITKDPTGLAFTIEDPGVVHWSAAPVAITADEALETDKSRSATARNEASDWLLELLAVGPMDSARIKTEAEKACIAWSTLKRAKSDLGVIARKVADGAEVRWTWQLSQEDHR